MTPSLPLAIAITTLLTTAPALALQPSPTPTVGVIDAPCATNACRYNGENQTIPRPTANRIVFMGDSITEGWKAVRPTFFAGDRIDRGISGETSLQMLARFQADVVRLRPATVHILAGTNDIAGNGGPTTIDRIEDNIRSMIDLAKAHRIKVILATVLPARRFGWRPEIDPVPSIKTLNTWIRAYARSEGLTLVDYYRALDDGGGGLAKADSGDGVHPSTDGYAKMETVFAAKVLGSPNGK